MTTANVGNSKPKYFDLRTPAPAKDGKVDGLMYEKFDKKTGQTILKSSGNDGLSHLLMKAKGYTLMTEKTARDYIQTKVATLSLDSDLKISNRIKLGSETVAAVKTDVFLQNVNHLQWADFQAFTSRLSNLRNNV